GTVTVSWTAPADNDGDALTGFLITWQQVVPAVKGTGYVPAPGSTPHRATTGPTSTSVALAKSRFTRRPRCIASPWPPRTRPAKGSRPGGQLRGRRVLHRNFHLVRHRAVCGHHGDQRSPPAIAAAGQPSGLSPTSRPVCWCRARHCGD